MPEGHEGKNAVFEPYLYEDMPPLRDAKKLPVPVGSRQREVERKKNFSENQKVHNLYSFRENEILHNGYRTHAYVLKKRGQDLLLKER